MKDKNIIIAGVGGQGVILASKIIMEVAMRAGYDVKESEVHGMAQRGGSVDCHIRIGEKVRSPLIPRGSADYIVSLELLETMRKIEYLADGGIVIANSQKVDPAPVLTGAMKYPPDISEWLARMVKNSHVIDAGPMLAETGSKKVLNIIMLGVLSKYLDFSDSEWESGVRAMVKEKFLDMNLNAFALGRGTA